MHSIVALIRRFHLVGLNIYPQAGQKEPRLRLEFVTHEDAYRYRQTWGEGGWILGRFYYPGSWTPSEVMHDCPESGCLL